MLGVVGGGGDGHGKPVRVARLGQQRPGLFHVLRVALRQLGHEVFLLGGVHAGAGGHPRAVAYEVDDLVHIDGVVHGLADQGVVKGLHGVVQVQRLHQVHGVLVDGEAVLHLPQQGVGQVDHHVQRPALQADDQGVYVGDDFEGHLVQLGGLLLVPVAVVPLHHQAVLGGVGDELEGAGAGHGLGDGGAGILGDDGGGEGVDKLGAGLGQGDDHMAAVNRLNLGDIRKRRDQRRSIVLRSGAAFQGIDHILDGDGLSVVERYALPQGEGVRPAIRRDLIVTGDGPGEGAIGAGLYQSLEDVEQHLAHAGRGGQLGVEVAQILCDTYRD